MLKVNLVIDIANPEADYVSSRLKMTPSAFRQHPLPRPGLVDYEWSSLIRLPEDLHAGGAGLSQALNDLGQERAEALGRLSAEGADVGIAVTQEVNGSGDWKSMNFFFDVAALSWMATAGASMIIDQYFYDATDDGDGSVGSDS